MIPRAGLLIGLLRSPRQDLCHRGGIAVKGNIIDLALEAGVIRSIAKRIVVVNLAATHPYLDRHTGIAFPRAAHIVAHRRQKVVVVHLLHADGEQIDGIYGLVEGVVQRVHLLLQGAQQHILVGAGLCPAVSNQQQAGQQEPEDTSQACHRG